MGGVGKLEPSEVEIWTFVMMGNVGTQLRFLLAYNGVGIKDHAARTCSHPTFLWGISPYVALVVQVQARRKYFSNGQASFPDFPA